MKCFVDGDQVCIVHDDFVDLQVSPAVFVPLASALGKELAAGGIAAVTDEAALYLVKKMKLCVMPFGDTWSSFPQQVVPGGDYAQRGGSTIGVAVLQGALLHDEMRRKYKTGLACMLCKAKVLRIEEEGCYACKCQRVPIAKMVVEPIAELAPNPFPHWFADDLVLDEA